MKFAFLQLTGLSICMILSLSLSARIMPMPPGPFRLPQLLIGTPLANQGAASNVHYFGGPVLSHVKVQVLYWGAVPADLKPRLESFYQDLVHSDYIDQLTEYNTDKLKIERGEMLGTLQIQPKNTSARLIQADIEQELEYQLASKLIPKADSNTLYMIHFDDRIEIEISYGLSCSAWYADHEVYRSALFGSVYYSVFPCGENLASVDELTVAASHELAEAITDPEAPLSGQTPAFPSGWLTPELQEIGDLCPWYMTKLSGTSTEHEVQKEWLNSTSSCNEARFKTSNAVYE